MQHNYTVHTRESDSEDEEELCEEEIEAPGFAKVVDVLGHDPKVCISVLETIRRRLGQTVLSIRPRC
eukprot:COSAG02_NODE_930_length_15835_cov_114.387201_3_plen_67_part_00